MGRSVMWDQWFAWRPVKSATGIVWMEWVWRFREGRTTRYFPGYSPDIRLSTSESLRSAAADTQARAHPAKWGAERGDESNNSSSHGIMQGLHFD